MKKALGMMNVDYDFRISSGNKRGGVSNESTQTNGSVPLFFGKELHYN